MLVNSGRFVTIRRPRQSINIIWSYSTHLPWFAKSNSPFVHTCVSGAGKSTVGFKFMPKRF